MPHLETYAADRTGRYLADAWYALFCIRGQASDLEHMVRLLARTDLNRPHQKEYVIRFLRRLGPRAGPAETVVRELLSAADLPDDVDRPASEPVMVVGAEYHVETGRVAFLNA